MIVIGTVWKKWANQSQIVGLDQTSESLSQEMFEKEQGWMLSWHWQWSETNDMWGLVKYVKNKGRERMDDGIIKRERERINENPHQVKGPVCWADRIILSGISSIFALQNGLGLTQPGNGPK